MKKIDKKITKILASIEKEKEKVAKSRDKLDELQYEIETLVDSFGLGIAWIEEGIRLIRDGIDSISEVV